MFKSRITQAWLLFLSVWALSGSLSAHAAFRLGLVLDRGGKDDKSFNTAAYQGALKAQKELGIEIKVVEAADDHAFESLHRALASKGYDLVVGIGVSQIDAVKKIAAQFPKVHFAIVDAEVSLPNVQSLLFSEHEGSFLVGALAAMKTKSEKVGFIGGMDIPLIRRFEKGYEAGVHYINPKAKVISNYVGVTSEAWNNPAKAKELALSQYNSGVEVIFSAAGASGSGLFDAAFEKGKFAIGVDSNQNWIRPGRVLTSMLKRVDVAVFEACKATQEGKFTAGVKRFGLENSGIDYALDENNKSLLTPEMLTKVNEIKKMIVAKKISVPDFYAMKK